MDPNASTQGRTGAWRWLAIALCVLAVFALAVAWNATAPPAALRSLEVVSCLGATIIWLAIWPGRRNGRS
jgi:hypothetical protein